MAKRSRLQFAVGAVCVLGALLTGCSRDPNVRKRKYLESGQSYFDKGQYREAEIQFQNAIQIDSRFAEAHYKLALAALKIGDARTATQELLTTVQIQPENYDAQLDLTNLLVLFRQFSDAKEHLDKLKKDWPEKPDVYVASANYHAAMNDTTAAMADMQTALQKDPNRSDSHLNLAMLQMHGEQWDAAEASFKKAVELSPKSTVALVSLGNFYRIRGRFPEAEQMYRQAIDSAKDDPEPRRALASLYVAENNLGQAEELLRRSKNDFPNNSVGYRMLGEFYYSTHQLDKATAEYASLYKDHPKDMVVKKNYIQFLIEKNRLDEARQLNDEILKTKPDDAYALVSKGEIEIKSGKASDAVNTLQAVLKNDPDNGVAHYQQGLAFDQLGNASRAEEEWRNAARLRPDLVEVHRALASVAVQRRDASGLAQEADQIIALEPGSPEGYLLRAVADIDRKQFATADENIHRSLEREPNNPAAYLQLGNLRKAQGQFVEAQKAYQQALDQDPNSAKALLGVLNMDLIQKQPDRAIATAKTQLDRYPKNAGFHIILGELLREQKKDLAAAEREFKQASDLDPKDSVALVNLGAVQRERGATDQALQTYLDGAKANPKVAAFYWFAGVIYENKQDWGQAEQQYKKVLEIQPENALASNNLAFVMLEQGGNVDLAFTMAQTAYRQLPDNASSADTLGWAFYYKRAYTSAITHFKEALRREPENEHFNYHLGMAYAKNGQVDLARQQQKLLRRINPKSPDLEKLQEAIDEAKG